MPVHVHIIVDILGFEVNHRPRAAGIVLMGDGDNG